MSKIVANVISWISKRPTLLREAFYFLLKNRTVLKLGNNVIILGYAEAVQVLQRNDDFQLSQKVRARFPVGSFILTMEDSSLYQEERALLCKAFYGNDDFLPAIRAFVIDRSNTILAEAENIGKVDVVAGLAEQVASEVVCKFFIGPDDGQIPDWFIPVLRQLSTLVIGQDFDEKTSPQKCQESTEKLKKYLQARVSDEIAGNTGSGVNIISRLVSSGFDQEKIASTVAGMAVAGIGNIAAAVGKGVNELLLRPEVLRAAQQLLSDRTIDERTKLEVIEKYAFEAMRFNPVFPILTRHCVRDTSISTTQGEEIRVPANTSILIAVFSAMHDRQIYPDPRRFQLDRPLDKHLHFGHGLKRCFGDEIASLQISEIFMALLKQKSLTRPDRGSGFGDLEYEGPYLSHFWVNTQ